MGPSPVRLGEGEHSPSAGEPVPALEGNRRVGDFWGLHERSQVPFRCLGAFYEVILVKWGHYGGTQKRCHFKLRKRRIALFTPCEDTVSRLLHVSMKHEGKDGWSLLLS